MEQLTLFEEFENIENLHEDNTIYFAPLNWRAKFKLTDEETLRRRIDIYCSSRKQMEQIENDLLREGWRIHKDSFPFPAISFSKYDMLIKFYGVYG